MMNMFSMWLCSAGYAVPSPNFRENSMKRPFAAKYVVRGYSFAIVFFTACNRNMTAPVSGRNGSSPNTGSGCISTGNEVINFLSFDKVRLKGLFHGFAHAQMSSRQEHQTVNATGCSTISCIVLYK